jgi:hypothetical protein
LSEYTRVLRARRGSPEKKSVSERYTKMSVASWNIPERRTIGVLTNILEVLQQVGDSFSLTVLQDLFIETVS